MVWNIEELSQIRWRIPGLSQTPAVRKCHVVPHMITVRDDVHVIPQGLRSTPARASMLHIAMPNENGMGGDCDELHFEEVAQEPL